MPAGRSHSPSSRRAFFILYLRRHGRFDGDGEEFATLCPLAAVVLRHAGVHFLFCFLAGAIVLTMAARNLPPYARWPLSFFAMPACIFHPISPPAWPFRLCRHGISPRVPAGRSRSLPRRRAFSSRFPAGMVVSTVTGRNFVTLCPLAAVVLRHAGVHFLFCFLAGMAVSTVPAVN
ncbi:hypothetical protein [Bianquea renquensis]|uniref:Uncharacterized protein n=1 Tax=Bianquea renquensis TaxID=2763661 RepID=A0A926I2P2_9FIRM|nr:hypothetical protein [Bianquea renquensis]MBC8544520.1 hypothetical protein [Bianquea renquensis]